MGVSPATLAMVPDMRRLSEEGLTAGEIGARLGVSQVTVSRVLRTPPAQLTVGGPGRRAAAPATPEGRQASAAAAEAERQRRLKAFNYRRVVDGRVRGFVDIFLPAFGFAIRDVRLAIDDAGYRSVEFPRIPIIGENGRYLRDDDASLKMSSYIRTPDPASSMRFRTMILEAVHAKYRNAFDGAEESDAGGADAVVE